MKVWEKPEVDILSISKTHHDGTPFDGEDSQWFDNAKGMWECEFGKKDIVS